LVNLGRKAPNHSTIAAISLRARARFLDIARGSALECAAIQDVSDSATGMKVQNDAAMKFDGVAESNTGMVLRSITIGMFASGQVPNSHSERAFPQQGGTPQVHAHFGRSGEELPMTRVSRCLNSLFKRPGVGKSDCFGWARRFAVNRT
jgi:hypothetical protein